MHIPCSLRQRRSETPFAEKIPRTKSITQVSVSLTRDPRPPSGPQALKGNKLEKGRGAAMCNFLRREIPSRQRSLDPLRSFVAGPDSITPASDDRLYFDACANRRVTYFGDFCGRSNSPYQRPRFSRFVHGHGSKFQQKQAKL